MVTMGASIIPLQYQLSSDSGMFVHIPTAMVHWFDGRIRVCRRTSEEAKVASDRRFKQFPKNNPRGPFKFVLTVVFTNYARDKNTH